MTTSGTTAFNPSIAELTLYSFNLAGLRSTSLVVEHMESARMATNMLLATWANRGVNLWAVDLVTVPLVAGQATYSVDAATVVILDAYVRQTTGSVSTDRLVLPISRSEYASYPNKDMQGFTTVYWLDRLLSPTVTLWPVPDGQSSTSFLYYRLKQLDDAYPVSGQTADVPYLWLEAFATALAARLALIWNPDKVQILKAAADEAYNIAADQNVETANFYISPTLSGYWR